VSALTRIREERSWRFVLPAHERQIYEAAGYGRATEPGGYAALIVIDATLNFTGDRREPVLDSIRRFPHSSGEDAWDSVEAIARLLEAARASGKPVVFTRGPLRKTPLTMGGWSRTTAAERLPEDDAHGESFLPAIQPRANEVVLEKLRPSAFFGTPLASLLFGAGCETVILCGGTTSGCVRASAVDAFSYGFRTFDRSGTSHAVSLYEIDQKYGTVVDVDQAVASLRRARRSAVATHDQRTSGDEQ
jgi:maleamate amidohydrolase